MMVSKKKIEIPLYLVKNIERRLKIISTIPSSAITNTKQFNALRLIKKDVERMQRLIQKYTNEEN